MTLIEWLENNLPLDNPFISAIALAFLIIVVHDFYSLLFSAVTTWFRKN